MTNAEFLNDLVPDLSQGLKDAVMTARGVSPLAVYSGDSAIELAEADLYMRMLIIPEFKEGSLSIKYDVRSLKESANRIYLRYGDSRYDNGEPLIQRQKL
jgi:hypothetical protein